MFSFFLPLLRVLFSSFSLQAESSESLDTRNCIFYENIERCEAPKCERVVPALDPEWNTLASTVEALCLSYIYIYFFKVQFSYTKAWDRDSVLFAQLGVLGCPMTAKCSKRPNKNTTLNKKWPLHCKQEGNRQ